MHATYRKRNATVISDVLLILRILFTKKKQYLPKMKTKKKKKNP